MHSLRLVAKFRLTVAVAAALVLILAVVLTIVVTRSGSGRALPAASTPPTAHTSNPQPNLTDCLHKLIECGFPSASDTGVRPGTALRTSGSLTLDRAGQILSGMDITGCLRITASRVTVRDSVIHGTCPGSPVISVSYSGVSRVVFDHVEIDGAHSNPSSPGLVGAGFTASNVNIHDTGDGIDIQNDDVVNDSYIHDLEVAPGDHTDGIQSAGGTRSSVTHNTIRADCQGCNSALIIGADLGPIGTFKASDNLLDGGSFTVYSGSGGYDSGDISLIGNRIGPGFANGPCSLRPSAGRDIVRTANVADLDGKALSDC